MARSFTGTQYVYTTSTTQRPVSFTALFWVKQAGSGTRVVWEWNAPSFRISLDGSGNLVYSRTFSTTSGSWQVSSADIDAVVSDRSDWWCVAITHDASSTSNDPVVRIGTEADAFSSVSVSENTAPVGTASTVTGHMAFGNASDFSGVAWGGTIGPIAIHGAVLSTGAQDDWRMDPDPVQASCLVSYLMENASPISDISGNSKDGTIWGSPTYSSDEPVPVAPPKELVPAHIASTTTVHGPTLSKSPAPTYPNFVSSSAITAASSGTTTTITLPAHQANDILVVVAGYNTTTATFTISAGQGWAELMAPQSDANVSTAIWWKRCASASEPNPVVTTATASTTNGRYTQTHVIRGCVTTGDPFEDATPNGPTQSTTPTSLTVDTTGQSRLVAAFSLIDDNNTRSNTPADWLGQSSVGSNTGGDFSFVTIRRDVASASTISGVATHTESATEWWKTLAVAFIPAPVPAPLVLAPNEVAPTTTVHGPTLENDAVVPQDLIPDLIAAATTVHNPTLANVAARTITPDHVAATTVVHNPTLANAAAQGLAPDHIAAATVVHEPTITAPAQTLAPDHIAAATTVHGPTLVAATPQTVTPDHTAAATVVHDPTIASTGAPEQVLAPDAIGPTGVVSNPTLSLASAQALAPDHVAATTVVHDPTVAAAGSQQLSPDHLASATTVHSPSILNISTQDIEPDHIAAATTVHAPTLANVAAQGLTPDHVSSPATAHAPSLTRDTPQNPVPDHIAPTTVVHNPLLENNIQSLVPDAIGPTGVVHNPTVANATPQALAPDHITGTTIHQPTLAKHSPQSLGPDLIVSTSVVYPAIINQSNRLRPDHVASVSAVHGPTMFREGSRSPLAPAGASNRQGTGSPGSSTRGSPASAGASTRQSPGVAGAGSRQTAGTPGSGSGR